MGASVEAKLIRRGFYPAGGGRFRTLCASQHTTTNIRIIEMFLPVRIHLEQSQRDAWSIIVRQPD